MKAHALRFRQSEVPHGTLETNRTCNLRCRLCYALERGYVKTLDELERELDLLARKRRLDTVTLLGGEPTLHPQLTDIVKAVKRRGLACQILTNGVTLLDQRGEELLDGLVRAGVDKLAVHVDSGQDRHPWDLEAVRTAIFERLERRRILFSLSVTIYPESQGTLPALLRRLASFRYFDGILAVLARDPRGVDGSGPDLGTERAVLRAAFGLEPNAFLPAADNEDDPFWLLYSGFTSSAADRYVPLSPLLDGLIRHVYRLLRRRHFLVIYVRPAWQPLAFVGAALLESLIAPRRFPEFLRLAAAARGWRALRFHYVAIQRPPEVDPVTQALRFCRYCPDATIRNGALVPVCLADQLSPLPGAAETSVRAEWREAVLAHLGEA